MMEPPHAAGSIWWCLHDFRRGRGPQEKFFILLTDCPAAGNALIALATSVGRHYHGMGDSPCGLPRIPCYRIEPRDEKCFPLTTYVQFDQLATTERADLVAHGARGTGRFVQAMDPQRFRSLLACMKKSEDIPIETLDVITETLKALTAAAKQPPSRERARTPAVSATGVAAVRIKYDGRCLACRTEFAGVMLGSADELVAVLDAAKPAPAGFLDSTDDGFVMARELAGPKCTCPVSIR